MRKSVHNTPLGHLPRRDRPESAEPQVGVRCDLAQGATDIARLLVRFVALSHPARAQCEAENDDVEKATGAASAGRLMHPHRHWLTLYRSTGRRVDPAASSLGAAPCSQAGVNDDYADDKGEKRDAAIAIVIASTRGDTERGSRGARHAESADHDERSRERAVDPIIPGLRWCSRLGRRRCTHCQPRLTCVARSCAPGAPCVPEVLPETCLSALGTA